MTKPLFENVGKDVKKLAESVASWIWGLHIFLAIVILLVSLASPNVIFFLIALLISGVIVVFGRFISKLVVIILYAYGEIADRLISIDSTLSPDRKPVTPTPQKVSVKKSDDNTSPKRTTPWICAFCECENSADTKYCKSCGREDIDV